jgi:hypothetical protein
MKKTRVLKVLAGLAVMSASVVSADVVAQYNFSADLNATSSDANVTANAFTVGAGISGSGRSGSSQSLFARASVTDAANQISLANAITANDYFSFTVDVDAGFEMDLTSFTFDAGYTRNGSFTGKQFKTYLLTSIDGFNTGGLIGSETVDATVNGGSLQYPNGTTTISLAGAQYQDLTGSTEFRLYISDNTGATDYIHRIDNVTLNGTVIPEPGTISMISAAGLGILFIRRRMMM